MITQEQKNSQILDVDKQISNLILIQGVVSSIGSLGGIYYAQKTGGGFWRSFGYFILGGILIGGVTRLGMSYKINMLREQKERIKNQAV